MMDYQAANGSPEGSREDDRKSLQSTALTAKQYFLVNLSKFIVEMLGTAVLGLFYLLMGDQQAGLLLGYWVVILFGISISGAHFNPAITLVVMLKKNTTFGSRRLKGLIYIAGQILGGLIACVAALFLVESSDHDLAVKPMIEQDDLEARKSFSAMVSECAGTFVLVFMFMISTDKKTQFSEDKVINCFIIASSYVGARLMAGGRLVTAIQRDFSVNPDEKSITVAQRDLYKLVGPCLNPALALGQALPSLDFAYGIQYILMPLAGCALALVFYEQVFIKSQEYMMEDEDEEEEGLRLESDADIRGKREDDEEPTEDL